MYKLRIYKKHGIDKGNLDLEEFFDTRQMAVKRYRELFVYNDYGLNPTLWYKVDNIWRRISGF